MASTIEGKNVSTDLGTTGYGAHLHYDYFKNTISHNTITINESNQPPACGKVNEYCNSEDYSYLDAEVTWSKDYQCPDSFTIKQWNTEAYAGVYYRRRVRFTDDFILDVGYVRCPDDRIIDNSLHFSGELINDCSPSVTEHKQCLAPHKPYCYITDCSIRPADTISHFTFRSEDVLTDLYCMPITGSIITAVAPGNPSNTKIPYIIERIHGSAACFCHVLSSRNSKDRIKLKNVRFCMDDNQLTVEIETADRKEVYSFQLE